METRSKRMKNDDFIECNYLTGDIVRILKDGYRKGFDNGLLDISYEEINDSMMTELSEWIIKLNGKVKYLNMEENHVTSIGASRFFKKLSGLEQISLSSINLYGNQLDDDCIMDLCEYIIGSKEIEKLDIGYNKMTDKGVILFSQQLINCTNIKYLDIGRNHRITDLAVPSLVEFIKRSTIVKLLTDGTSISNESSESLRHALRVPIDQREIPISSRSKSAAKLQSTN